MIYTIKYFFYASFLYSESSGGYFLNQLHILNVFKYIEKGRLLQPDLCTTISSMLVGCDLNCMSPTAGDIFSGIHVIQGVFLSWRRID